MYQPVMLISLLENGGVSHEEAIARDLLAEDRSQIEYYTRITNNMVGRVLRNHEIVHRDRESKQYSLTGFEALTEVQVRRLIELCKERLLSFTESRGNRIFDHRRKSSGYISGTIRYEILKRAKFRCELCGISAHIKALEVDHILPRSQGGPDDTSNLQALCYSCNAMKRDRDSSDFRNIRESYEDRQEGCLFCEIPDKRIIMQNELAYVIRDGFPVTDSHTLIIPKRHVATYFDLYQPEINACNQLMSDAKDKIEANDESVSGFNIGINSGSSAGQTVFHCHIHLIPRREGDVDNPRGGVRHLIPNKGFYVDDDSGNKVE